MENTRPIFIVGCPRSGTTLLSVLLHAHPRIAMPPETRFLLATYYRRDEFGDLREAANRRKLAEQVTGKAAKFSDLRLNRKAVVQAIIDAPPTLGSAFATIWREFARSRGKSRWGEKRPAYWREMPAIHALFPTAQIIHLVRDPRACVASLEAVPWWHRNVAYSAALWSVSSHEPDKFGKHLSDDSYRRVYYEDLVRDVRGTLTDLCGFLGEDFDEAMLEHAGAAKDIVPARKHWHGRVGQDVDPARAEGWRSSLTPQQIGLVELATRRQMDWHGYEPSTIATRPDPKAIADALSRKVYIRGWLTKRKLADARLRLRDTNPLAAEI